LIASNSLSPVRRCTLSDPHPSGNVRPDHFDAAAEWALRLLAVGVGDSTMGAIGRSLAARGLTDAAAGVDHVRLRWLAAKCEESVHMRDGSDHPSWADACDGMTPEPPGDAATAPAQDGAHDCDGKEKA
jgi:hypothetical protein